MRNRTLCILISLILVVVILGGTAGPSFASNDTVLAERDGVPFTLEDFNIFYMKQLGAQGLTTFFQQMIVYQKAKDLGLTPTPEEKRHFITEEMTPEVYAGFQELYSQKALDRFIDYTIMNEKYRNYLEQQITREKGLSGIDLDREVSQHLEKLYESELPKFNIRAKLFRLAENPPVVGESSSLLQEDVASQSKSETSGFEIVSIKAKVTESNDVWWKYAWRLTLKNNQSTPVLLDATIEFQDSEGFIVDDDREYGLFLDAHEQRTFTGYALIDASVAGKVSQVACKVRRQTH